MCHRHSARVRGRITRSHKLDPFESDERLITGTVEATVLQHLSQEADNSLCAVFILTRQINLIAEHNEPLVELDWSQHGTGAGSLVFAVVVKGLQHQLWCGSAGEVQTYHLKKPKVSHCEEFPFIVAYSGQIVAQRLKQLA